MTAAIIVAVLTSVSTMALVLFKPNADLTLKTKDGQKRKVQISVFWLAALLGAVITLAVGTISPLDAWRGLTANMFSMFEGARCSDINPVKILVLFFSMTALSVFLDELGFFKRLALLTLKRANSSQKKLFLYLYLTVSVLTIFTSNDIVILTFTPFICCFCKNAQIDPTPYVVSEFVAANTWSMLFIIGNPTNIYLASSYGIGFAKYAEFMAIPTVFAGLVAYAVLWLLFRKKLKQPMSASDEQSAISDKGLLVIGLVHLVGCIVFITFCDLIGVEMWFATLCFAVSLNVCTLVYSAVKKSKPAVLWHTAKRIPWELAPFVLGMFVVVLSLEQTGVSATLARFLCSGAENTGILTFGVASTLSANLLNNIPMSVLFSSINSTLGMSATGEMFASVIGSNVGAFLTPVGALAGIMFGNILRRHEVKFSFVDFVKYGIIVVVPTLFAALGGLYVSMLFAA